MGDRLTQLQDAVISLRRSSSHPSTTSINTTTSRHLAHGIKIVVIPKQEADQQEELENQWIHTQTTSSEPRRSELARDLITKEQQIELLISILPGLDNSEQDQERNIRELEEELKVAEAQRQEAIKEREETMAKLNAVICSIRRP